MKTQEKVKKNLTTVKFSKTFSSCNLKQLKYVFNQIDRAETTGLALTDIESRIKMKPNE